MVEKHFITQEGDSELGGKEIQTIQQMPLDEQRRLRHPCSAMRNSCVTGSAFWKCTSLFLSTRLSPIEFGSLCALAKFSL